MAMTVDLLLYVLALLCFVAAFAGWPASRFGIGWLGLAFYVLTYIV